MDEYITVRCSRSSTESTIKVDEALKLLTILGNSHNIMETYLKDTRSDDEVGKAIENDIWHLIAKYYIGIELPPIIPKITFNRKRKGIGLEFGIVPTDRATTIENTMNWLMESICNVMERKDTDQVFEFLVSRLVDSESYQELDEVINKPVTKTCIQDFDVRKWKEYCRQNLSFRSKMNKKSEIDFEDLDQLKTKINDYVKGMSSSIYIHDITHDTKLDKIRLNISISYDEFKEMINSINNTDIVNIILNRKEKDDYINKIKEDFKDLANKDNFKKFNKESFNKIEENSIGDVINHINEKKIDPQISLF